MMIYGFIFILFICMGYFTSKRALRLFHFYQQEEYDTGRFIRFMFQNKLQLIDKKVTITLLALGPLAMAIDRPGIHMLFISLILLIFSLNEKNPLQSAKKKLVLTSRVQRIAGLSLVFLIVMAGVLMYFAETALQYYVYSVVFIQSIPWVILLSNAFLAPYEQHIRDGFRKEAEEKLETLDPIVIGVTGSYGKTSVKHILKHILSASAPTLATPGSVNTLMGITRVIREELMADHKYFIVEMGAYGPGSIKSLCDFTPPDYGILTAVGDAHYERFKSLDTVAKAKFELAQSVYVREADKEKGTEPTVIINGNLVKTSYIETYTVDHEDKTVIINFVQPDKTTLSTEETEEESKEADIEDFSVITREQTVEGISFTMKLPDQKEPVEISAPIYGLHQVDNIAVCVVLAVRLGIDLKLIKAALKSLPQIRHRLEVINAKNYATVIDDTYNANPIGFMSALDILKRFHREKGGRAIVVTPGLVELGQAHKTTHYDLGIKTSQIADAVVIVNPKRIISYVQGVMYEAGDSQEIIEVENFKEARRWIDDNIQSDDVVLYANDLPDLYEDKVSF